MWEDLQRQIRSLRVTVHVNVQGNSTNPSSSDLSMPSTSTGTATSPSETAKNFKKALLENYKRENQEIDYEQSQPSTSRGITSARSDNSEECSTSISLSNLLPSETELKERQSLSLTQMLNKLDALFASCQGINQDVSANVSNDHTYSTVSNNNGSMEIPGVANVASIIAEGLNFPPSSGVSAPMQSPSAGNVVYTMAGSLETNSSSSNSSFQMSASSSNGAEQRDAQPGNSEATASSSSGSRGRQYQKVCRYGRRMYLR